MADGEILILTPTARLARAEGRRVALERSGEGAWQRPRILAFPAWLTELRDDWLLAGDDERVPIGASQAQVLWQSVIDRDVFIGEPEVAELAQRAWRLIHEYGLDAPEDWPGLLLSSDSRQFRDWAGSYRSLCAQKGVEDEWAFAAGLPGRIAAGRIEVPGAIELLGFDLPPTPLQQRILDALESAGCDLRGNRPARPEAGLEEPAGAPQAAEPVDGLSEILAFAEPDDELLGAARWARERLEADADQSVAVVVPDLSERLERVEQVFRRVFDPPGHALEPSGPEAWHVSLGRPLTRWPLAADALVILALSDYSVDQPRAGRLLRSPFLDGWHAESGLRTAAWAGLIRYAPYRLTINELVYRLERTGAQMLAARLAAWKRLRGESTGPARPSQWAGRFQDELSAIGFGHGRGLDSREYQVLERWHRLLEDFSALDAVAENPLSRARALAWLSDRARSAVFRERNPGVPVEVLGIEEALGSRFDALWITTLEAATWPRPARRDPLIPGPLQACIPRATGPGCLERARLELAGLVACAPQVRGSFARGGAEEEILPTALVPADRIRDADPPEVGSPAPVEEVPEDVRAPALQDGRVRGGTGVLKSQSDCPFKAFAERRLDAGDLSPPRPGLDAASRGSLVHAALEHFWHDLSGRDALASLDPETLGQRIETAVEAALAQLTGQYRLALSAAGRALEAARLTRLLGRWLELEKARGDFSVARLEHKLRLRIGGLELGGKIDRVDALADGGLALIDYKTGRTGKGDWFPEARMADPQLPAYAVAMDPKPTAIAFARVRPENPGFEGLAETDAGIPGVTGLAGTGGKFSEFDSWSELLAEWESRLEALAADFGSGRAEVDPRRPRQTCRYCHLHGFCRIYERAPLAGEVANE